MSVCASGAKIALAGNLGSYKKDIAVSLSGSAANFLTCIIMRWVIQGFGQAQVFFFFSNLLLGTVNLICVGDLDGAVAMESVLYSYFDPVRAEKILSYSRSVGLFLLLFLGVGVLMLTKGNFSLLFLLLGIIAKNKKDRESGLFR